MKSCCTCDLVVAKTVKMTNTREFHPSHNETIQVNKLTEQEIRNKNTEIITLT